MNQDASDSAAAISRGQATARYLPSLLRASVITIVLSCLSMALAVALGILIATGRVYGGRAMRTVLIAYVELMRGTPILLQLFVLYYGIAAAIRLPAFAAALLGLALNYAAYESEIYRAALEAVPHGTARGRTDARPQRTPGPDAHPRTAGVPARARADDERLRRAAEGLVARLGADGHGAHEADADLRDQPGELGRFRASLCAALYLAMSLPLAALARAARTAMEGADAVTTPVLQFHDVHLRRGARQILRGVSFDIGHGELVAVMGPSGSGKTTILRAIAGLEPFQDGRVTVDGVSLTAGDHDNATLRALRRQIGMVFQFHCLFEHLSALENVWLAPVHAHGVRRDDAERRAHELLEGVRRRSSRRGAAARTVGRRGPARRDRACAGRRTRACC